MYHVMGRGDRREDIFLDDVDRQDFLKTLAEGCHSGAHAFGEIEGSEHKPAQMDASQATGKSNTNPTRITSGLFYG